MRGASFGTGYRLQSATPLNRKCVITVPNRHNKSVNKAQSLPHSSSTFGTTDLLLLLTSFIWGTNYAVIKFDLEDFLPLAFSGPRFLIASICMAAALAISRQGFKLERRHILPMF